MDIPTGRTSLGEALFYRQDFLIKPMCNVSQCASTIRSEAAKILGDRGSPTGGGLVHMKLVITMDKSWTMLIELRNNAWLNCSSRFIESLVAKLRGKDTVPLHTS